MSDNLSDMFRQDEIDLGELEKGVLALEQRAGRMRRAAKWWKARAVEEHPEYEVLALDQYPTSDDVWATEALVQRRKHEA